MSFWLLTGGLKVAFGYYGLAEPLVKPMNALWELEFDGDGTSRLNSLAMNVMRGFVIALRVSVPTCVFFFDTNVFYTVISATFSTLVIASSRHIGRVTTWGGLLAWFMETVDLHDDKIVSADAKAAAEGGGPARAPDRRHHHARQPKSDWCIEARSRSWQLMSRSWNAVVHELRWEDYLSDHERDELLFPVLAAPTSRRSSACPSTSSSRRCSRARSSTPSRGAPA